MRHKSTSAIPLLIVAVAVLRLSWQTFSNFPLISTLSFS